MKGNILRPHVETSPDHIIPIISLNSYQCHMMASVMDSIQNIMIEVIHIPLGKFVLHQTVNFEVDELNC